MQRGSSTDHLSESSEDLLPTIQENNPDGFGYAQLTLGDEDKPYFVHLSDKRKGKRPSSIKKVYLNVLLVLLVVAVVFISLYVVKLKSKCRRAEKSKSPVLNYCTTSGCVDAAYFIQNAIDPKANPCEDFFQYSCGRWMNKHPIPDKKNFWGINSVLSQENFLVMRKLLERPVTEFKSTAEKEAAIYYKACMNDTVRKRLDGSPLQDVMKDFPGWKNNDFKLPKDFNITDYSQKLHANFGFASPFISVSVGPDDKNSSKNVIKIMQSGLGLQVEYYNKNLTDKVLTAYLDYMIEIRMLLGEKDRNQTKNQMLDVLLFEKNLSVIHVPSKNMTQVDQYYVKMTIKELQKKSPVILDATTDNELRSVLLSDHVQNVLQAIGYRGVAQRETLDSRSRIIQSLYIKDVIEPRIGSLDQFAKGLEMFNVLGTLKLKSELLKPVFTPSSFFEVTLEEFLSSLHVQYSESGSNLKDKEVDVFKSFTDLLEMAVHDRNNAEFSLSDIVHFITGSSTYPPLGFSVKMTLEFKHGCAQKCKCCPTASTCALTMFMPVHIDSVDEMKVIINSALKDCKGFGKI